MNSKAAYLCMTQTGYGTRLTARMKPLYRYLFAAMLPAAALSPMYASSPADTTAVTAKAPLPLPATGYEGRLLRSEFMSYTIRQNAANDDREAEWNYLPVENFTQSRTADGDIVYTATVELPEFWADRIIMLHCEGGRNSHRVSVNGTAVGSARDSGTPSEFELPNAVAGRTNTLRIELPADTDEPESGLRRQRADLTSCFLYSQPRTRIWDYDVSTVLTGSDGELTARVVVENRYPSEETFSLCFDVFSPEGRVEEYGTKRVTLPAGDRDTVTLRATIYGAGKKLWGAEKPALYRLTLFVRKGDRILEYVPVNVGFGTVSHAEGRVYRNGKPVELRPARCDATTPAALRREIAALKKEGFNTLWPDTQQPWWFYDICDRTGMYVIDQANINTSYETGNRRIGGCLSNDPAWLPEYMERTQAMFRRSHTHPCIVAWSLGGQSGNGFNLYRTYLWLRTADPNRPILYDGAGGEWNNDLPLTR